MKVFSAHEFLNDDRFDPWTVYLLLEFIFFGWGFECILFYSVPTQNAQAMQIVPVLKLAPPTENALVLFFICNGAQVLPYRLGGTGT